MKAPNFIVTDEVPWIAPKPVYLLSNLENQVVSMKTHIRRKDVEGRLNELWANGKPNPFTCFDVKDGILTFEEQPQADTFADQMEETAFVISVDSHSLFREIQDIKAVSVLFLRNSHIPTPSELAKLLGPSSQKD